MSDPPPPPSMHLLGAPLVVAVEAATLRQQLVFAFATGDGGALFEELLDHVAAPESAYRAADFERDLFVAVLAERHLTPEGPVSDARRAFVRRMLLAPPREDARVAARQAVLRELAEDEGRAHAVDALAAAIAALRLALTKTSIVKVDPFERRLQVLQALRAVGHAAAAVTGASALGTVGAFGSALTATAAFARLEQLLAAEGNVAEVDVRLRLSFDGKIREFAILDERVDRDNPFARTAAARWIERAGLFLRGRSFGEHELFAHLMDAVFDGLVAWLPPLFLLEGELDVVRGALRFRAAAQAAGLTVSLAALGGGARRLEGLFNPLLLGAAARRAPTPTPFVADTRGPLVVVTGPNSGGKTRLLQAVALAQLLGEGGFFVPAARAELPRAGGLFVSLLDPGDPDGREGRLGTELLRIRRLFEALAEASGPPLVVLDELCSGTNPDEGETIFRLVVGLFGELADGARPDAFVTTHFLAFAARLAEEAARGEAAHPALRFLAVALDGDERPTYGFVEGVATSSLAHRTAARLGVTAEALRPLLAALKR